MSSLVAGAPLLAGGPPGWVVYGALGVLTVGGLGAAYMMSRAKSKADGLTDAAVDTVCASCKKDPCEALRCGAPGSKYRGGAHGCMTGTGETRGDGLDSHHTPAADASPLPRNEGPAIQMEPSDHRLTASYGGGLLADAYRGTQRSMIESGNFLGAVAMDVADIHSKFGDKYDQALIQMSAYAACLKESGTVK